MNYPPILFHPINSITAYKGQIIYDTPETEAKAQTPVPYLQWQPAPGVTPPSRRPDGMLSDLMLPPPAAPGQVSPGRPAPAATADWAQARCPARRAWRDPNAPAPPRRRWRMTGRHAASRCYGMAERRRPSARALRAAGRLLVRRAELAGHAGHRGPRRGFLHDHRRTARCRDAAAELAGDGRRRHRRQRVGHRRRAAARRHVLRGGEAVAGRATSTCRRTRPRRSRRPRCSVLSTSNCRRRSTGPGEGRLTDGSNIP